MANKTHFLNIRCPKTLKEELRRRATADHRTIADEARYLIEQGLAVHQSGQAQGLAEFMEAAK